VKNKGNNDAVICKKCSAYKTHLKEALDELISIRMINEFLQKELLTYATPKSTWWIEPDSNGNVVQPFENRPSKHSSKMSYPEVAAAGCKWIPASHISAKKLHTSETSLRERTSGLHSIRTSGLHSVPHTC